MYKSNGKSILTLPIFLVLLTFLISGVFLPTDSDAKSLSSNETKNISSTDMREYAKDAYIFTYPLVMMYRSMHRQAIDRKTGVGFGEWLHLGMSTPQDQDIVTPNNDTPYSYAWVDLRAEPWVMTMPPIDANRFYTSQWDDIWGFVAGNSGSADPGNTGNSFLLAGPNWDGNVPEGISKTIRGETQFLGSLTRTQAFGTDDLPAVQKIQGEYKLQPLSSFLGQAAPEPAEAIDWPVWEEGAEQTLRFWKYVAHLLPLTVPNKIDAEMYEKLAAIGIEPGKKFDPSALSPDMQKVMQAGVDAGHKVLLDASKGDAIKPYLFFGDRKFQNDDYYNRALGVFMGIFGNVSDISAYTTMVIDNRSKQLDGSKHNYTLTFPAGHLPDDKFFWSITMYKLPSRWLVSNPINRYSIGSSTPGVQMGADGSLKLFFSKQSPGAENESNWLPAPDGPFWMVMRHYGPGASIKDRTYKLPAIVAQ